MADEVISCILGYLKELAEYQYKLICNSEVELNGLTTDLKHLQSILKKAARHRDKGEVLKTYEKEIRDLIYEAEETIESHVTPASVKGNTPHRGIFSKFFGPERTLAEVVKRIRKEIREIDDLMVKEMLLDQTPNEAAQEATRTVRGIRQIDPESNNTVVGFKDIIEEWGAKLRNDEIEVIAVEGMPGRGKTTVASKLFNDPGTMFEFPKRIWLNVSDEPCKKDIYLRILEEFHSEDVSRLSEIQLLGKVREKLKSVIFLLVVDDVWDIGIWREIDDILKPLRNGTGSFKVLLTTRYHDVAKKATLPDRGQICNLRKLDEDESWELLQLKVCGNMSSWPKELEEDGKKIAKECDGLPLALVVIGGMLMSNLSTPVDTTTRAYFQNVSKDVHEHMLLGDNEEAVEKIISLSYDKLPYCLINCFLYLGVFPAGHHISTWKLKSLWIAEGYIMNEHREDKTLEEIADGYVEELIIRNLETVVRKNVEKKVKTCCVHGCIRAFCKKVGGDAQYLFHEIKKSKHGNFLGVSDTSTGSFRRICIHSDIQELFEQHLVLNKTRSFLCFPKNSIDVPRACVSSVLDPFELLRVFEGSSLKFAVFSTKLSKLIRLRYLSLAAGENFTGLPKTVKNLWRLQTLVIVTLSHAFEIKVDLSDMPQLRHVKTKGTLIIKAKHDEAGSSKKYFKSLHTLSRISADSCNAGLMEKAKYLKTLGIRGQLDPLMKNDSVLKKLDYLLKLKLIHTAEALTRLPNCFPTNLKILTLSATHLGWDKMATLGRLVHLEVLKLKENAFTGEEWDDDGEGFLSLRYLQVERSDLKTWEITPDSFRSLEYLSLKACNMLDHIPTSLSKTLHTLEIESATEGVLLSVTDIQDKIENTGRKFELMTTPKDQMLRQELVMKSGECSHP